VKLANLSIYWIPACAGMTIFASYTLPLIATWYELSEVDWMNSRGLGILVSGLTTLRNRGGDLKLACASESIDSFLNKCKMLAIFESYDTVEEAVESFKSTQ